MVDPVLSGVEKTLLNSSVLDPTDCRHAVPSFLSVLFTVNVFDDVQPLFESQLEIILFTGRGLTVMTAIAVFSPS